MGVAIEGTRRLTEPVHGSGGKAKADRARRHHLLIEAAAAHQHRWAGRARQLQRHIGGQGHVVVAGQVIAHQRVVGLGLALVEAIQHGIPQPNGCAAIGSPVVDQGVCALLWQSVNAS